MICFNENKNLQEVFHFYATFYFTPFLIRKFFKTVGELLHLLTLHPKLIFRGALKKALMLSDGRSYQTQGTLQKYCLAHYLQGCVFIFAFI